MCASVRAAMEPFHVILHPDELPTDDVLLGFTPSDTAEHNEGPHLSSVGLAVNIVNNYIVGLRNRVLLCRSAQSYLA